MHIGLSFLAGEEIPGVLYKHNNYVEIIGGPHCGSRGSLITVLSLVPEPLYVVELEAGHDAKIAQSAIRFVADN